MPRLFSIIKMRWNWFRRISELWWKSLIFIWAMVQMMRRSTITKWFYRRRMIFYPLWITLRIFMVKEGKSLIGHWSLPPLFPESYLRTPMWPIPLAGCMFWKRIMPGQSRICKKPLRKNRAMQPLSIISESYDIPRKNCRKQNSCCRMPWQRKYPGKILSGWMKFLQPLRHQIHSFSWQYQPKKTERAQRRLNCLRISLSMRVLMLQLPQISGYCMQNKIKI